MLKKVVDNISKLSVNSLAFEVFKQKKIQSFVIDLNKDNQLFAKGEGVDGEVVGYYSQLTSLINPSKKFNQPYNFKDTGDMFRSFRVIVSKDGFVIEADADKLIDSDIIDKDSEILGLTDESKIELVKEITPFLIKEVREQIIK
jgi:hypothetical protein